MSDPPYDVGDVVKVYLTLTDHQTGSPITPSMVTMYTRVASSLASYASNGASPPIVLASNSWRVDVNVTNPGVWQYRWVATGPNSAEGGSFPVATPMA